MVKKKAMVIRMVNKQRAIETMIRWFERRRGKVSYSQVARLGPKSYDCSSAVYFALVEAGLLPKGSFIGNTDTLYGDLERNGWRKLIANHGHYQVQRGDIFIWGNRGASGGDAGHTGVFIAANDQMIHCTCGWNGRTCAVNTITVDDHDTIWRASGRPAVTVYRYGGGDGGVHKPVPTPPSQGGSSGLQPRRGTFTPSITLPVSGDTDPHSPALAQYPPGSKINFDSYIIENGYVWISYIAAASGKRRYVAIGPDDGRVETVWGWGFN